MSPTKIQTKKPSFLELCAFWFWKEFWQTRSQSRKGRGLFPNKIIGDGLIEIWFSTNNQMSHPGQVVIGIRLSSMKTYLFHNMLFAVWLRKNINFLSYWIKNTTNKRLYELTKRTQVRILLGLLQKVRNSLNIFFFY